MMVASNIDKLLTQCRQLPSPVLIVVDGFSGAGKTTFAEQLAASANGVWLDLDDLLPETPPETATTYAALIDASAVARRIEGSEAPVVVVAGICVRDVLEAAGFVPVLKIYVKRLGANGMWHDGLDLEGFAADPGEPRHWLEVCDLEYHGRRRPHEDADFIFERVEDADRSAR
jgi:chloramphenicol 3-O-phosphotransferase